jgi:hypothetical protein
MKIEAGKFYKTRDGRKAFVVSVDLPNPFGGNSTYTVSVYIEGLSNRITVTDRGRLYINTPDCAADLVAEWREPASEDRVVYLVRGHGGLMWCECRENRDCPPKHGTIIGSTRVTVTEGVFA